MLKDKSFDADNDISEVLGGHILELTKVNKDSVELMAKT